MGLDLQCAKLFFIAFCQSNHLADSIAQSGEIMKKDTH